MHVAGYDIDWLVVGFPGKTVCHGGLGWSTIALLRGHGRVALIDTGPMGMRRLLKDRLQSHGLTPADVTDVLLTHSHHDHSINWTMFPKARIAIGAEELNWSLGVPWGETPVPELYMRELNQWPHVHRMGVGEEVLPQLQVLAAPGHTPGHVMFVLQDNDRDVIFTGDAAKSRAELMAGHGEASLDAKVSGETIQSIWALWQRKPHSVVVPGHDVPMTQANGQTQYIQHRQAAVQAFFGDDLHTVKVIELS